MNVLIVEDDENKGLQITDFLRDTFPAIRLQLERSLQSGIRALRVSPPNLVLLDMTLPNYDTGPEETGGTIHNFGGREFLRQVDELDLAIPVIVITQFETFGKPPDTMGLRELDRKLAIDHPVTYRGLVYYNASMHEWKDKLKQMIVSKGNLHA